jgi:hypothetical protein
MKGHLKDKLLQALEKHLGIITPACKEVGVSRETYYQWYRNDEEFKKNVDAINDIQMDFVESQLFKNIKAGSERSILFYMKYKGRERGYSDEINMNIKMEQPLLQPIQEKKIEETKLIDDLKGKRIDINGFIEDDNDDTKK